MARAVALTLVGLLVLGSYAALLVFTWDVGTLIGGR